MSFPLRVQLLDGVEAPRHRRDADGEEASDDEAPSTDTLTHCRAVWHEGRLFGFWKPEDTHGPPRPT